MDKSLLDRQRKHVLFTWSAQNSARPLHITGGEGARFDLADGSSVLDFESQSFNVNAGHGHPAILEAIRQATQTPLSVSPAAVHEAKADLGETLAGVVDATGCRMTRRRGE